MPGRHFYEDESEIRDINLVGQSQRMHRALKRAGKDVTFVKLDGEDHWLSGAETHQELLPVMAEFLDEHL